MILTRIQNEAHAIQEILKFFPFWCRPASSQTCLFFTVMAFWLILSIKFFSFGICKYVTFVGKCKYETAFSTPLWKYSENKRNFRGRLAASITVLVNLLIDIWFLLLRRIFANFERMSLNTSVFYTKLVNPSRFCFWSNVPYFFGTTQTICFTEANVSNLTGNLYLNNCRTFVNRGSWTKTFTALQSHIDYLVMKTVTGVLTLVIVFSLKNAHLQLQSFQKSIFRSRCSIKKMFIKIFQNSQDNSRFCILNTWGTLFLVFTQKATQI